MTVGVSWAFRSGRFTAAFPAFALVCANFGCMASSGELLRIVLISSDDSSAAFDSDTMLASLRSFGAFVPSQMSHAATDKIIKISVTFASSEAAAAARQALHGTTIQGRHVSIKPGTHPSSQMSIQPVRPVRDERKAVKQQKLDKKRQKEDTQAACVSAPGDKVCVHLLCFPVSLNPRSTGGCCARPCPVRRGL